MARHAVAVALLLASIAFAAPTAGMAQESGVVSAIYQGTCEAIGEAVAPLIDPVLPTGQHRGSMAALPAANAFTTVPVSREALTASDHVIVVSFPVGDQHLACGEIGGTLTDAGAVIVGLRPTGEMNVSGIAYLAPAADPAQTGVSLFLSGEDLPGLYTATFLPLDTFTPRDAARFAELLAAREDAPRLAGPLAGSFVQQQGQRMANGAGTNAEDFMATVTFTNPAADETPWDIGFAFRGDQNTAQIVAVSSDGFWYYQDSLSGAIAVAPLEDFAAPPGGTTTLDLVVEGSTAILAVNGKLVAELDLPPATAADVYVGTGFFADHHVDGRELAYEDFTVWQAPGSAPATADASARDDAARFAVAIAARDGATSLAGPFSDRIPEQVGGSTLGPAGVAVADFSATATFRNPTEQTETLWDLGFAFRGSPEAHQAIFVDAQGYWYSQDTRMGQASSFDTSPGGTNTIDLVVKGTTALLGVNGEFVARVDLPEAVASDVYIGVGFFEGHKVAGREILFRDFTVWGP